MYDPASFRYLLPNSLLAEYGIATGDVRVSYPAQGADNLNAFLTVGGNRYVLRAYLITPASEVEYELRLVNYRVRPLTSGELQQLETFVLIFHAAAAAEYLTGSLHLDVAGTDLRDSLSLRAFNGLRESTDWRLALRPEE